MVQIVLEMNSTTSKYFNPAQNFNQNADFNSLMAFTEYFKIYFYIHFFIATLIFLFLLYLILFVSPKEMYARIKYLLLNFVINNYALILVFFLWQPIPISPFFGGFCAGVLKYLGNCFCRRIFYDIKEKFWVLKERKVFLGMIIFINVFFFIRNMFLNHNQHFVQ